MRIERQLMAEAALVVTEVAKWRGYPARCEADDDEVLTRCREEAERLVRRRCAGAAEMGMEPINEMDQRRRVRALTRVAFNVFENLDRWVIPMRMPHG